MDSKSFAFYLDAQITLKNLSKNMTCLSDSLSSLSSLHTRCSTISQAGYSTLCNLSGTILARSINSHRIPCLHMKPLHSNKIYPLLGHRESPLSFSVHYLLPLLSSASSFSSGLSSPESASLQALPFKSDPPSTLSKFLISLLFQAFQNTDELFQLIETQLMPFTLRIPMLVFTC